jgi:serine/threonine-protein phosphatase 6 regulatory ankyrin repeat subunit B
MTFDINEIMLRFPHMMEQLLQKLDKMKAWQRAEKYVARSWQKFIDTRIYPWHRIVNIPTILNNDSTYLHITANHGQIDTFKVILDRETDKNVMKGSGSTSFLVACWSGSVNIAEMLIKKSDELEIDLRRKNKYGNTALHLACNNGKSELAEWLIKNSNKSKIDVSEMNVINKSSFSYACQFDYSDIVRMILDQPLKFNLSLMSAKSGFHLTCCFGLIPIVEIFLEKSKFGKLYLTDEDITTGSLYANTAGYTDIVDLLQR